MNKHFQDTRYYLKRAGETATKGIGEEVEPVRNRLESITGGAEPEPSRLERLRADLASVRERVAAEANAARRSVRKRLERVS
jgi:predicted  nucleic acid-binding Zn-ribbon protein